MISTNEIRSFVEEQIHDLADGEPLDARTSALIAYGVRVSATALDMEGSEAFARLALDLGASIEQVTEALLLVSGLGVHSLMEGATQLVRLESERSHQAVHNELEGVQAELWNRYVGEDPYWSTLEQEKPGFLDALLRLSPDGFKAFFDYCAVPWKTRALPALVKEYISIAVDACPNHQYLPGLRLHLANARKLGAGRVAILETLAIAASAPRHSGIR